MFSIQPIALTAAVAFIASIGTQMLIHKNEIRENIIVALIVGSSVLAWRLAGNVAPLNDDPIPLLSPNDLLCPVITYLSLGLYAAFHRLPDLAQWARTRAWLTLVAFTVNVLFI